MAAVIVFTGSLSDVTDKFRFWFYFHFPLEVVDCRWVFSVELHH